MKGVFKIFVDGELVYDKGRTGRVPTADESARAVEPRLGPALNWRDS